MMMETGRIKEPSVDVLWRLAELYGLPKRWVMECGGHLHSPVVQAALGYEHLTRERSDRYAEFIRPAQPNHQPDQEVRERLLKPDAIRQALPYCLPEGFGAGTARMRWDNARRAITAAVDAAYPNQSSEGERDA